MLDIVILAVGKVKTGYFRQAVDEYLKRLSIYARIVEYEVKPSDLAGSDKERSKKEEGERLAHFLDKNPEATIFLLEENGKQYDSLQFADKISRIPGKIVFVLGGTAGIDSSLRTGKRESLSLSAMTFNHEMARAMLAEQLYRAATIINKKDYHY